MKKNWLLLCLSMALILILSACGTSDAEKEKVEVEEDPETELPAEDVGEDVEDEEPEEGNGPEKPDEVDGVEENTENDESVGETEPDNSFFEEAEQVNSDTQDYSIHLLPNYKLTGEEPGKDILYLESDDSIFMRIETMSSEDVTIDYLTENTMTFLEAASNGKTPEELTDDAHLPTGADMENVKGYTVDVEDGTVTGIIFERDNLFVRLSIFDSAVGDHFEDFLHMGETVANNE